MTTIQDEHGATMSTPPAGRDRTNAGRRTSAIEAANDPFYRSAVNAASTRSYRGGMTAGLSTAEREDLFQEILLDIYERKGQFDPARGGPGTFTGMVSAHRTAEFLCARKTDRQRLVFAPGEDIDTGAVLSVDRALRGIDLTQDAANDDDTTSGGPAWLHDAASWSADDDLFSDSACLRDLEAALAYMSNEQASLFHLLALHQDLPAAAKASGLPSATFYRRVADLQMHLRMFGIRPAA